MSRTVRAGWAGKTGRKSEVGGTLTLDFRDGEQDRQDQRKRITEHIVQSSLPGHHEWITTTCELGLGACEEEIGEGGERGETLLILLRGGAVSQRTADGRLALVGESK